FLKLRKEGEKTRQENLLLRQRTSKFETTNKNLLEEKQSLSQHLLESNQKIKEFTDRYQNVIDVEAEKTKVLGEIEKLRQQHLEFSIKYQGDYNAKLDEAKQIEEKIAELQKEFALLDESATLFSFGFYNPRYDFEQSSRYQLELDKIRLAQKNMISGKTAAICSTEWTVNGSRAEGRKQINQTLRLILRAFNGESDAAIAKVKYNNVNVMEARILKAYEALNKLVSIQCVEISRNYLNLKLEELYLVHEYQEKLQEEKEEQRRIREQMREEEIARREIEKALQDAEREETRYAEALRKAREEVEKAVGDKQTKLLAQIEALQNKLTEVQANKERAISRAQMTRSGHVYIISNIGSFGEDVYKIGMTRRLDPMDRVIELGDASVPFRFDVHAIIYSEDAPALENQLHKKFDDRRINLVNNRKEFFRVSLQEIADVVREHHGEIEFTLAAEAAEYRKTLAFIAERQKQSATI
ncbi:MAG TPA: DUF4041 domain-containing protein, partial [Pyrinomonadaceae bacterium]